MARLIDDSIDYKSFLGQQQAQNTKPASAFVDELVKLGTLGVENYGDPLPWNKTRHLFRLRPQELTIWAGINNHGKSNALGQVMLWQMLDTRVLIASMEMPPAQTLFRMTRQASKQPEPSVQYLKAWSLWTDDRLWIYDQQGSVDLESIVGMCWYASQKLRCNHIVIDSLMKCGIAPDDYGGQKDFVDELCQAAKHGECHIHLVHHMRKGRKESDKPDKFDVRGASEVSDLADNIVIVHRNLEKEHKQQNGDEVNDWAPDTSLIVAKQRHGNGWIGDIPLYFDKPSLQLTPKPNKGPMHWPGELMMELEEWTP